LSRSTSGYLRRGFFDDIRELPALVFSFLAGKLDPSLSLQTGKHIAAGSMIQSSIGPSPIPQFADVQRECLPVPIAMLGEDLSNLAYMRSRDSSRGAAQNDGVLAGIFMIGALNHDPTISKSK
jgi:hypothetical protein